MKKDSKISRTGRFPQNSIIDVVFASSTILGLFLVFNRDLVLPVNYFYDGNRIQSIAKGQISGFGDTSYENVAWIYKTLGLAREPLLASLMGYLAFAAILWLVRSQYRDSIKFFSLMFIFFIGPIFGAVYLGYYSKDVFVLPIVLSIVVFDFSIVGEVLMLILMIIYALNFRSYWFLIFAGYLVFRLAGAWNGKFRRAVIFVTVFVTGVSAFIWIYLGQSPDYYRQLVNSGRLGSVDATTAIIPFFSGMEPFSGVTNNLITMVFLLFPVPLVLIGQPLYLITFLLVSTLWTVVFANARGKLFTSTDRRAVKILLTLITVFIATQSVFEPDYGSALRHVTPLLPLLAALLSIGSGHAASQRE